MTHYFNKILVLVTRPREGEAIRKAFGMTELEDTFDAYLPVDWWVSVRQGNEVYLAQTRCPSQDQAAEVGPETASFIAWECMRDIDPDVVVSAGVAAGLASAGARLGDIYQCRRAYYHHRLFTTAPESAESGEGGYDCVLVEPDREGLKTAIISTSSSFMLTRRDLQVLARQQATLKDMEAAAVASVARVRHKKLFVLKGVTDVFGLEENDKAVNMHADNMRQVMENVAFTLCRLVDDGQLTW